MIISIIFSIISFSMMMFLAVIMNKLIKTIKDLAKEIQKQQEEQTQEQERVEELVNPKDLLVQVELSRELMNFLKTIDEKITSIGMVELSTKNSIYAKFYEIDMAMKRLEDILLNNNNDFNVNKFVNYLNLGRDKFLEQKKDKIIVDNIIKKISEQKNEPKNQN